MKIKYHSIESREAPGIVPAGTGDYQSLTNKNMNTASFLHQEAKRIESDPGHTHARSGSTRYHQSVLCDGTVLYSYGRHYPLYWYITTPAGTRLSVKNVRGYSNTTAKHIAHVPHADINVKMPSSSQCAGSVPTDYKTVREALIAEHEQVKKEMEDSKRKNTKKYAALDEQRKWIEMYISKLNK